MASLVAERVRTLPQPFLSPTQGGARTGGHVPRADAPSPSNQLAVRVVQCSSRTLLGPPAELPPLPASFLGENCPIDLHGPLHLYRHLSALAARTSAATHRVKRFLALGWLGAPSRLPLLTKNSTRGAPQIQRSCFQKSRKHAVWHRVFRSDPVAVSTACVAWHDVARPTLSCQPFCAFHPKQVRRNRQTLRLTRKSTQSLSLRPSPEPHRCRSRVYSRRQCQTSMSCPPSRSVSRRLWQRAATLC